MTLDEKALQAAMLESDEASVNNVPRIIAVRQVVSAYLKALEGAGMVIEQGWQPIETAPRDDTQVLVWSKPEDGFSHVQRRIDRWRNGNWYHSRLAMPPTHWRPLPAPPAMLSAAEPTK